MKKKALLIPLALLLALSLIAIGCPETTPTTTTPSTTTPPTATPPPPEEETFHWRMTCVSNETQLSHTLTERGFGRLIEEGSGGRVKVDVYATGVLMGLPDILPAVTEGTVEVAGLIPGLAAGVAASSQATELAFGAKSDDVYQLWELCEVWGLHDILREEFAGAGLYYLGTMYAGELGLYTTFPVNTVDDLQGKLAWMDPGFLFFTDFGLVPSEMPGFDPYMALKLGTLDGLIWTTTALEDLKMGEVADYFLLGCGHTCAMNLLVNLDAWNSLGPDLQRQIQDHVDANSFKVWKQFADAEAEIKAKAMAEGFQFITLPPNEEAKVRTAVRGYWDAVAGMSPGAAEATELYKAWMEYRGIPW